MKIKNTLQTKLPYRAPRSLPRIYNAKLGPNFLPTLRSNMSIFNLLKDGLSNIFHLAHEIMSKSKKGLLHNK